MKISKKKSFLQKLSVLVVAGMLAVGCGSDNDNLVIGNTGNNGAASPPPAVLVALNNGANTIKAYRINDLASGALTEVTGNTRTTQANSPAELVLRRNTVTGTSGVRAFYTNLTNSQISIDDIDQNTGALLAPNSPPPPGSPFAATVPGAFGLALDSTNTFLYVNGDSQIDCYNVTTQPVTQVAGFPVNTNLAGAAGSLNRIKISANNQFLFTTDRTGNTVYAFTRNTTTGALTPVAGSPFATGLAFADDLELSSNDGFLYVSSDDGPIAGFTVTPTTGVLVPLVPAITLTANGGPRPASNACGMLVRGNTLYISDSVVNSTDAFTIAANGQLTRIAGFPVTGGGCGPVLASNTSTAIAPIYFASFNQDQIFGFLPNAAGALAAVAGSPVSAGAGSNPASLGVFVR